MTRLEQLILKSTGVGGADFGGAHIVVDAKQTHLRIRDGRGGVFSLDLSRPDMRALADALECLADEQLPPGAGLLKVHAASQVYLVSRRRGAEDGAAISLANLFDPVEQVRLSAQAARVTALTIRHALDSRA